MSRPHADRPCALCQRPLPTNFHHLVPRTLHSNKWFQKRYTRAEMAQGVQLCQPCHSAVHKFIDEKTLGREYASLDALQAHPELSRFVGWVRTQPPGRVRTKRAARRSGY